MHEKPTGSLYFRQRRDYTQTEKTTKEKKWFGITRSPEEDLALVDFSSSSRGLSAKSFLVVMVMSFVILGTYLVMNSYFFPGYPVPMTFAEENETFAEHYPPFRMTEWVNYSITREFLDGELAHEDSFSRRGSFGYSLLASPLTKRWDAKGMYFTNAFILWISALIFFFLMLELVEYWLAAASTFVLALATPNLFYASSAYAEPTAQLLTVLSVFLFVKGMVAEREWVFYGLSGLTVGMTLFVKPSLAAMVVLFAVLLVNERGRFVSGDKNLIGLFGGFIAAAVMFLAANKLLLGSFGLFPPPGPASAFGQTTQSAFGGNIISGIWTILFNSPTGLVFIMPVVTIVPLGLIVMWRNEMHTMTIVVGALLFYGIVISALSGAFVTGECVGTRQLLPVLPFFVLPLAFLWHEQAGERAWLAAALVLTLYMSGFGWWTGKEHGKGLFIGALHDRDARSILLARKGVIGKPAFKTTDELVGLYLDSLRNHDMKVWLQCLDQHSLEQLRGVERMVFEELCATAESGDVTAETFIESVDPNNGIVPATSGPFYIQDQSAE